VTLIARDRRLEQLRSDRAITTNTGERASVQVSAELDETTPWDLVLVTVLASQVGVLLPTPARSAAKNVMFMFNTFESLDRLRDAVGAERFAFGFPAVVASIEDGKLTASILRGQMKTTVTDPTWAEIFTEAGIPSIVHPDMQSWLRTHAALIAPLAIAGSAAHLRGGGVSGVEAMTLARAMKQGFDLVRTLGNTITPTPIALLSRMPVRVLAATLWVLTRLGAFTRTIAVAPAEEPRMLIDEMSAAGPGLTPALLAVRP
jgi:2-dehydropantoate 2-reductase